MRIDLLFTILAIPTAVFAILLGDSSNVAFKVAYEAQLQSVTKDSSAIGVMVVIGIACIAATVYTLGAAATYIKFYYDLPHDPANQIKKGIGIVEGAFSGFFLYATLVGPINNGPYAWFDGLAFITIIAVLPALLHINSLVQEALQERAQHKADVNHDNDVIEMQSRE